MSSIHAVVLNRKDLVRNRGVRWQQCLALVVQLTTMIQCRETKWLSGKLCVCCYSELPSHSWMAELQVPHAEYWL